MLFSWTCFWRHLLYCMCRIPFFYWLMSETPHCIDAACYGCPQPLNWMKSLKQGFWCMGWACLLPALCYVKKKQTRSKVHHMEGRCQILRDPTFLQLPLNKGNGLTAIFQGPGRAVACNHYFCHAITLGLVEQLTCCFCFIAFFRSVFRKMETKSCRLNTLDILTASLADTWASGELRLLLLLCLTSWSWEVELIWYHSSLCGLGFWSNAVLMHQSFLCILGNWSGWTLFNSA